MPFLTIAGQSVFYTLAERVTTSHEPEASATRRTSPSTTVFIHGLGSSSCFYQTIIHQLKESTRCIAIDTPGSGLSELGPSEQSVSSIAEVIIGLLNGLKIKDKVVIVGHSMGGIIASHIAATYPDLVKGVVLIGPVDPSPAMKEVFDNRIKAVSKDGLETLADTISYAAVGSKAGTIERAFIRTLILGTSPAGYISLCNVIANAQRPLYANIKVPLLIIAGRDDKTAPMASSETILDAYGTETSKSIDVLEEVGHWHCIEDPHRVASSITMFLSEFESV